MTASTNGSATATVETLTAEVRVLQVGNRQITLSVVRQLDQALYVHLEPLGRVRTGRKVEPRENESPTEVVGRNITTGALEWAYAPKGVWPKPCAEWLHWASHMRCRRSLRAGTYYRVAECDGKTLSWTVPEVDRDRSYRVDGCELKNPHQYQYASRYTVTGRADARYDPVQDWLYHEWDYKHRRGDFCDLDGLRAEWSCYAENELCAYLTVEEMRAAAEALPLIVLAGLR